MATTFDKPAGTLVWPPELSPQAMTVPSDRRATLWFLLAATAATFDKPGGTFVMAGVRSKIQPALASHVLTVPSALRAVTCEPPAAIAMTLDRPPRVFVFPLNGSPPTIAL